VDGLGNALTDFDDPNLPSLLAMPLLGFEYDANVSTFHFLASVLARIEDTGLPFCATLTLCVLLQRQCRGACSVAQEC
jgi:hypothetical protein